MSPRLGAVGPPPVYINGRFLGQPLSGVQRYAIEMVRALDVLVAADPHLAGRSWEVLTPRGLGHRLCLTHIGIREVGPGRGHGWEQATLPLAARSGLLVNLGNSGPILHPRKLVVIHDASVFRTPDNYGTRYGVAHRGMGRALARTAHIGTVSRFSRGELAEVLGLDPTSIVVAPNGHEHMKAVVPDVGAAERLGLSDRPYFLFIGSPTRNKNLGTTLNAFGRLRRDARLVLVGDLPPNVFAGGRTAPTRGDVMVTGRLPDETVAALYRGAAALLFPSLYEGFGIPPLEAMVHGCPVVAADIPATREVCGEAALFVAPDDPDGFAAAMRRLLDDPGLRAALTAQGGLHLPSYSWAASARVLAEAILLLSER